MKKMKRWASVLLTVCMLIAAMPHPAMAEPADTPVAAQTAMTAEPTGTLENAPMTEPTEAPATEPTNAPATEPTDAPATEPTDAPATEPTNAPVTEPTDAPATEPTDAPATESLPMLAAAPVARGRRDLGGRSEQRKNSH